MQQSQAGVSHVVIVGWDCTSNVRTDYQARLFLSRDRVNNVLGTAPPFSGGVGNVAPGTTNVQDAASLPIPPSMDPGDFYLMAEIWAKPTGIPGNMQLVATQQIDTVTILPPMLLGAGNIREISFQ